MKVISTSFLVPFDIVWWLRTATAQRKNEDLISSCNRVERESKNRCLSDVQRFHDTLHNRAVIGCSFSGGLINWLLYPSNVLDGFMESNSWLSFASCGTRFLQISVSDPKEKTTMARLLLRLIWHRKHAPLRLLLHSAHIPIYERFLFACLRRGCLKIFLLRMTHSVRAIRNVAAKESDNHDSVHSANEFSPQQHWIKAVFIRLTRRIHQGIASISR